MEKSVYRSGEELDLKGILIQLAFGTIAGLAFIVICGLAEVVADWFMN